MTLPTAAPAPELRRESRRYVLEPLCAVLFVVSALSLLASYVWWTSVPWTDAFGRLEYGGPPPDWLPLTFLKVGIGFWIELVRSALLLSIAAILLGGPFRPEVSDVIEILLAPRAANARPPVSDHRYLIVRVVAGAVVAVVLIGIIIQHFWLGPRTLGDWFVTAHHAGFAVFRDLGRPYLAYATYSLINFGLVGTPVFTIGLHAVTKDWRSSLILRRQIEANLAGAATDGERLLILKRFLGQSANAVGRYTSFFFGMALVVGFERFLGHYTLTRSGQIWTGVGFTVASVYLLFILVTLVLYELLFRNAIRRVEDDPVKFTEDVGTIRFVRYILVRYWLVVIALLLLGGKYLLDLLAKIPH